MFLNNEWVKHEIEEEIKKDTSKHTKMEKATTQNLWDTQGKQS